MSEAPPKYILVYCAGLLADGRHRRVTRFLCQHAGVTLAAEPPDAVELCAAAERLDGIAGPLDQSEMRAVATWLRALAARAPRRRRRAPKGSS